MINNNDYILEAAGICKNFGGVRALENVDLQLKHGEILGLVGDNGAGKSTLIKIISGTIKKDKGEIYIKGEKVNINNPKDAKNLGIETVYQDLNLINNQNVPFNIFLGREITYEGIFKFLGLLNYRKMLKESLNLMDKLKVSLGRLDKPMNDYSGGQRQAAAIGKLIYWGTEIAIMDEPTAALGVRESGKALELIKMLNKELNLSVIIISHNMQHIFNIVDRIMVLRRGKLITVQDARKITAHDIVKYITGAEEVIKRNNKNKY